MADPGVVYSEKTLKKVEKQITKVYSEAQKDIQQKMDDFIAKHDEKDKVMSEKLKKGEISPEDYSKWQKGQVFQGDQWRQKKGQINNVLTNANKNALQIVNGGTIDVFAENCNYESFAIEQGFGVNFGFGLVDSNTMTKLIKEQPKLLPLKTLNVPKDKAWNQKKITNCVTQGILQGESIDKIANRIAKVTTSQNRNSMMMNARTAVTGAQNAGREQSMKHAAELGINIEKEWMATLDNRTRTSHAHLDGEKIKVGDKNHDYTFSNGCRFPGDPRGPGWEVYNCRCTLVTNFLDYPDDYERLDNINRKPIRNMTYDEWHNAKSSLSQLSATDFIWNKNYAGMLGRDYGKADTSDAMQEIADGKTNSLAEYMDENGNLTPDRVALHKQIIDNYLVAKTPERGTATMTMMGGGPASGKSSVLKAGLYRLPDKIHSVTIDPDDIKQYLPGYAEMSKVDSGAASFYHEESSMIAKQLANTCFTENFDVTYDGTGDGSVNSVMKKLNGAKERGYQVNGVYVTIDIDEALTRNRARYEHAKAKGESPRLVPDGYVINCHKRVTQISMDTSDQFDSIKLYDNNGKAGDIKLIATGGSGNKLSFVSGQEKAFEKFLDKVNYDDNK